MEALGALAAREGSGGELERLAERRFDGVRAVLGTDGEAFRNHELGLDSHEVEDTA